MSPWSRAAITVLAFALGFAGVWLYLRGDSTPEQDTEAQATATTAPAPPGPTVFVPGLICDGCSGPAE